MQLRRPQRATQCCRAGSIPRAHATAAPLALTASKVASTQGSWLCLQGALISALKNSPRQRNREGWLSAEIPHRFTHDRGPERGGDPAWVPRKQVEGLRPTSGPGSLALFSPEMQGCEGKGSVVGSARLARLRTHRWSEAGWASEVIKHLYRGEKCVPEKGGASCQQLE